MRAMTNVTHIEGYFYEHDLTLKVSGENSKNPGTEYITGTVSLATDEAMTNIVPVHYTYVTATTKTGNPNNTFNILKAMINGDAKSYMEHGEKNKYRIDSAIGLNEFYSDRNGKEELVSVKRNEGGFIHSTISLNENENARNTFRADMLITGVVDIEADEEKGTPEKVLVKGAIFDFRKSLLPIEFSAINPGAMNYFRGLDASNANPTLTQVWGNQVSQTINRRIVVESAFDEDYVQIVPSSRKDFVITGALKVPYTFDSDDTMTKEELKEAIVNRETYLATLRQRREEYKSSKKTTAATSDSQFNF